MFATREDVALAFLRSTSTKALREAVKRNKPWATALGGFRANSLTPAQFQSKASWYAGDVTRLEALCAVFLEDHGAGRKGTLKARLAAIEADPAAAADVRALCNDVAALDWAALPATAPRDAEAREPAEGSASSPVA